MKQITKVRQQLKRHGTIKETNLDVLLLTDNEVEVRVRYAYEPKKDEPGVMYNIFKKCREIIHGE